MPALTVKEMVLLHLSKYKRYHDRRAVPEEITQKGIAEAVGVQRSHISVELKRMREEKGWVEEKKAHAGPGNQKKVYFTTPAGDERVRDILSALENRKIYFEGEEQALRGPQAVDYILRKTDVPYPWAVREVMRSRRISLDTIRRPSKRAYSTPMPVVKRIYGRDRELEKLSGWYQGRTPILTVVGTGGIGKSTLAASFASGLKDPVMWYSITEEGQSSILEEMSVFFRKNEDDTLSLYLSSQTEDMKRIEDAIAGISRTYLLVIDDYHLADRRTRDQLEMIKRALSRPNSRGKMIVLSRAIPDFYTRKDVSLDGVVEELFLRGISQRDALALLRGIGIRVDEEAFNEAYSVSAGHPILLQMAAASGGDPKEMKAKVMAYLTEEFYMNMDSEERAILARLSAFGKPVPSEAFLYTEKDVEALHRLLRRGLTHYNQKGEYFVHEIISALFLSRRKLRKEHLAAAEYYRETGRREHLVDVLNHLIKAGDFEEAEREIKRNLHTMLAYGQADSLREMLESTPETPVFLSAMARATADAHKTDQALKLAERAVSIADKETLAYTLRNRGIIQAIMGDYAAAEKSFRKALEYAGDMGEKMRTQRSLGGMALVFLGKYSEAEALEREAMEYFGEQGNREEEAMARMELAMATARQGRLEESVKLLRECAEYYENERFYRNLGNTYNQMAMYEAYLGKREEARRHFEMAALYGEMIGNLRTVGFALMNSADNYAEMKNGEKALAYAERARKIFQEIGASNHAAVAMCVIAKAHLINGDDETEEAYAQAEKELLEAGERELLAEVYCERAELEDDTDVKKRMYEKAAALYLELQKKEKAEKIRRKSEEI